MITIQFEFSNEAFTFISVWHNRTRTKNALYVDNILTSIPDESTLLDFYKDSRHFYQQEVFELKQSDDTRTNQVGRVKYQDEITKVLRMRWDSTAIEMSFPPKVSNKINESLLNKSEISEESSSIFDPLGFLYPVTVRGICWYICYRNKQLSGTRFYKKTLLQNEADLAKATKIKFSRRYFPAATPNDETLHNFAESRVKAYGA